MVTSALNMMAKGQQGIIACLNILQPGKQISVLTTTTQMVLMTVLSTPSYQRHLPQHHSLRRTHRQCRYPLQQNELSSEEIPKNQLKSTEEVLKEYLSLAQYPCKMTTLSIKLTREAFFGDVILARCTPRRWQDMARHASTTSTTSTTP